MLAPRAVKRKASKTSPSIDDASTSSAEARADARGARDPSTSVDSATAASDESGKSVGNEAQNEDDNAKSEDVAPATASAPAPIVKDDGLSESKTQDTSEATESERLSFLRWTLEECFSDWALSSQHPELFRKIGLSMTGYVHISNLLTLPPIAALTSSMADITRALQTKGSEILRLDETGFQVARVTPVDLDAIDRLKSKDWAERTFYLENIPSTSSTSITYTLETLRDFLQELLEGPIVAIRLPQLYKHSSEDDQVASRNPRHDPHYGDPSSAGQNDARGVKGKQRAQVSSSSGGSEETAGQRARRERTYQMPLGGGPFKGFAFVVLEDGEAAERALQAWHWDNRGLAPSSADTDDSDSASSDEDSDIGQDDASSEDDVNNASEESVSKSLDMQKAEDADHATATTTHADGSAGSAEVSRQSETDGIEAKGSKTNRVPKKPTLSPRQRALISGFRVVPITTFNALRSEYLSYSRDITLLCEKHAETTGRYNSSRKRSESPERARNHGRRADAKSKSEDQSNGSKGKRKRSPSPARWEKKRRSPSIERWQRKPLSPSPDRPVRTFDPAEDAFPRGCVVFVRRLHPNASTRDLKALFQAVLEREEIDPQKLLYVDHLRNVDSCHLRFADPATATFFATFFQSRKRFAHEKHDTTDPSEAFSDASQSDRRAIESEVVSGVPESIYWSKVPLKARQAYSNSAQDGEDDAEAAEQEQRNEQAGTEIAEISSGVEGHQTKDPAEPTNVQADAAGSVNDQAREAES